MYEKLPDLGLEVGDKVECHGAVGKVDSINSNSAGYPIVVKFKSDMVALESFLRDGRSHRWHKTITLKLIEKKIKPKTKIKLYRYTYKLGDTIVQTMWTNSEEVSFNTIKTEIKYIEID